jgi:hypothetical protein
MNWNKRVRISHFRGPRFQNFPEEDPRTPYKYEILCMHQSAQELDPPLVPYDGRGVSDGCQMVYDGVRWLYREGFSGGV